MSINIVSTEQSCPFTHLIFHFPEFPGSKKAFTVGKLFISKSWVTASVPKGGLFSDSRGKSVYVISLNFRCVM